MSCESCKHLVEINDLNSPYVVRTCGTCGREINLREPGENGHGLKVEKGDRFAFPEGWLQISANPLKGTSILSRYGLGWFAELIFVKDIGTSEKIEQYIEENEKTCDKILRESELLSDLQIDKQEDAEKIFARLESTQTSAEWWAFLFGTFNAMVRDAIKQNDAPKAAWAARAGERCRAMFIFKNHLEEVVWMGHSARRIIEVIRKWHGNTTNDNEEFWQQVFSENPYVLNQLFSVPVIFLKDKAYVGGMNVDRQDAKFVDYLYTNESSNDALLVELKTPATKLLGGRYRKGVYKPSAELSGSVVQALDYRREIARNVDALTVGTDKSIDIFSPRCVVIAGNAESELNDDLKRKSFELYRTSLKDLEIITYDELFKKAETLATLFNLIRKKSEA